MAQSYQNYKQNLSESELKLQEIGQRVQPYDSNFIFNEVGNMVRSDFRDDQKNDISVRFHRFKEGSNGFEVEYTVNNRSVEAFKTDMKHFFKIISTVIQVINEFIEKYNPTQLFIDGEDKPDKEGQKDKLWLQYAKVNLKADDYVIGNYKNGFMIQNNKNVNRK
jgi:hypothetical protein